MAVANGKKSIVVIGAIALLLGCSEPNEPTIEFYLAVQRGDIDQMERHIHWGVDLNALDVDGATPLHTAARQGQSVVVQLLLQHGADPNGLDREGHTPLHDAVLIGRTRVADLLLAAGAQIDPDALLRAAVASEMQDRNIAAWLAAQGADFDHYDEEGKTPLIRAVIRNNRITTRLLIEHGANVNHPDAAGRRPLDYVDPETMAFVYRVLRQHGAARTAASDDR